MRMLLPAKLFGSGLLLCPLFAASTGSLFAQDTREVTEPVIPAACTVLTAALHAAENALAQADESQPDTARIQHALDHCGKGRAVELKPAGANNAFLSGPLEMREGVTLLIDKGNALCLAQST